MPTMDQIQMQLDFHYAELRRDKILFRRLLSAGGARRKTTPELQAQFEELIKKRDGHRWSLHILYRMIPAAEPQEMRKT
jgi:hypothetical protein